MKAKDIFMKSPIFSFCAIVGQEEMKKTMIYNAIDASLGGVVIRGQKRTAKSTAVRGIVALLPPRHRHHPRDHRR